MPTATWDIQAPAPTTLMVFWPEAAPPSADAVLGALADAAGNDALPAPEPIEPADPAMRWSILVEGLGNPLVLWCEPARPVAPGELGDAAAEACPWVLGVQTVLPADDPLTSYAALLYLLHQGLPTAPAILDANCTLCHHRATLDRLFCRDRLEPPADVLWVIQAVQDANRGVTWLHTHGLDRCGRPELEMLDVPASETAAAATLLDTIAHLVLEDAPAPGTPLEISPDHAVTLHAWEGVMDRLGLDAPGGVPDRGADSDDAHGGCRAVVLDADGDDTMLWPAAAVRSLQHGGVIYQTPRHTERQAQLAGATWATLVEAAGRLPADGHIAVKATIDGAGGQREHVWLEADRLDEHGASAHLSGAPPAGSRITAEGSIEIARDAVSDWRLMLSDGRTFGPDDAPALEALGG